MNKLSYCDINREYDACHITVHFRGDRKVGWALRSKLLKTGATASLRSYMGPDSRHVIIQTNAPLYELTQHVLVFFQTYESLENIEGGLLSLGTPDGEPRKLTWDQYLAHRKSRFNKAA